MKKILNLFACVLSLHSLSAQFNGPAKTGYAYQQSTLPGRAPTVVVDETGKTIERERKPNIRYHIFLEFRQSHINKINPTRIWIGGKVYGVKFENITTTPYIVPRSFGPRILHDTLVKKTSYAVIKLQPVSATDTSAPQKIVSSKIASNAIVVEYYCKKKRYYYVLNYIKSLEPLVLQ